ncbi:MAG: hypothetical protein DYG91_00570 [Chloroflexi bacterium CFX7]|nr:hypothetical protein [Chloroflexi bacterium CFX7]RIL03368.1 MAG: hypothetical protein DCC78_04885 [bacterium]
MEQRVSLTPDARQAIEAGVQLCHRARLAIFTPEHLLAGALAVLGEGGAPGLPSPGTIEATLEMVHGTSDDPPADEVSFSPGARTVLDSLAVVLTRVGRDSLGARDLALGTIVSGEVTPMFFSALDTTKERLLAALAGGGPA